MPIEGLLAYQKLSRRAFVFSMVTGFVSAGVPQLMVHNAPPILVAVMGVAAIAAATGWHVSRTGAIHALSGFRRNNWS